MPNKSYGFDDDDDDEGCKTEVGRTRCRPGAKQEQGGSRSRAVAELGTAEQS